MNTLNKQRMELYKATPLKLKRVDELISLIKGCFGNSIETNGIRFDNNHLKLGELTVKMVEIDPQTFGGVLVHWYPKKDISTKNDPFCSAYMLNTWEINKIIKDIKQIKEYYETKRKTLIRIIDTNENCECHVL